MLAEAENPKLQTKAFDMTYGWEFHHIMNQIAAGKQKLADIKSYVENNNKRFGLNDYRMYFTTNHDENAWNGTAFERLGDAAIPFQVLCYAMPGMPLIYDGQEAGMNKRLSFFEKDAIDWKKGKMDLTDFYTKLNLLKHRNTALANGADGGDVLFIENGQNEKVVSLLRKKGDNEVLFLINLSAEKLSFNLTNSPVAGEFRNLFSNNIEKITADTLFSLDPYAYKVYYK
jgi:glycosidase